MPIIPVPTSRDTQVAPDGGWLDSEPRRPADIAEKTVTEHIDPQRGHHAYGGGAEAQVPGDLLPEIPADQRPEQGADIDAHVIDRVAGFLAGIPGRVTGCSP